MTKPRLEILTAGDLVLPLTRFIRAVVEVFAYIHPVVSTFYDASSAAKTFVLPDGNTADIPSYRYVKTDASVNVITITPFGSQSINATSSYSLSSQGDSVTLQFDKASQSWWSV